MAHFHPFPGIATDAIPHPIKGWEHYAVCDRHYATDIDNGPALRPCVCQEAVFLCGVVEDLNHGHEEDVKIGEQE